MASDERNAAKNISGRSVKRHRSGRVAARNLAKKKKNYRHHLTSARRRGAFSSGSVCVYRAAARHRSRRLEHRGLNM